MSIEIRKLNAQASDYSKDIARLYKNAGWLKSDDNVSDIDKALKNSYCAFGAFDADLMVGFFRALSDGVSDAYLLDLIVDETYRKKGIGSKLTKALLDELARNNILWTTCIASPNAKNLYAKFGKPMQNFTPIAFSDENF